jgi:hypothetical protein
MMRGGGHGVPAWLPGHDGQRRLSARPVDPQGCDNQTSSRGSYLDVHGLLWRLACVCSAACALLLFAAVVHSKRHGCSFGVVDPFVQAQLSGEVVLELGLLPETAGQTAGGGISLEVVGVVFLAVDAVFHAYMLWCCAAASVTPSACGLSGLVLGLGLHCVTIHACGELLIVASAADILTC